MSELGAGKAEAFEIVASHSGTAAAAQVYLDAHNTALSLIVGVYSNANGHPGSLLSSGAAIGVTAGSWNGVALSTVSLNANKHYWLVLLGGGGTLRVRDRKSTSCPAQTDAASTLSAMPSAWRVGKSGLDCPASANVTAIAAGSEVPAVQPPLGSTPPSSESPSGSTPPSSDPPSGSTPPSSDPPSGSSPPSSDPPSGSTPPPSESPSGSTPPSESPSQSTGTLVGESEVQPDLDTDAAGMAEAFRYTASASGTVDDISLYAAASDSASSIVVGLYGGSGGEPGSLLTSATIATPVAGTWNSVKVPSASVSEGGEYWLAALAPQGTLALQDVNGGGVSQNSLSGSLAVLPASWSAGPTWASAPASFYASGTVLPSSGSGTGTSGSGTGGTGGSGTGTSGSGAGGSGGTGSGGSGSGTGGTGGSGSSGSGSGSLSTDCIKLPSACGYPDATNSGVPAGSSLSSRSEEMHVSTAGSTIKDLALTGTIYVEANNVTIEDTEVVVNGTQSGCSGSCGGKGIWIAPGVSGTTIKGVTCRGGAASGANVTQYCVMSNSSSTKVEGSRMYDCTECYTGPGTLVGSFLEDNGTISGEHYEDIYYGGGEGALVTEHDTMLDPHSQTAVVFASVDFGNQTTLTIENDLLAGGGYVIYGGGSGSGGKVLGPVTVKDNRFSREFYPDGGFYGIDSYMNEAVTTWSGNYWDESLEPVGE